MRESLSKNLIYAKSDQVWTEGKLSLRYVGPFEILERVGKTAYRLALPPSMSNLHDVFHVSMLQNDMSDPSHVLKDQEVEISLYVRYEEPAVAASIAMRKS